MFTYLQQGVANFERLGSPSNGNLRLTTQYDFVQLVNVAIAYALILAGVLSVIFVFMGGIHFILSGGKEDKIKSAVHTIRYAIIGLIVSILSFGLVAIVGRVFGYDLVSYISLDAILEIVNSFTRSAQPRI